MTDIDKENKQINDESWNKKDFIILGSVFVFFIIGMVVALHMDLISMEIRDRMRFSENKRVEKVQNKPVDFTSYMHHVQKKIKKNWQAPETMPPTSTVVEFAINKKGIVIGTRIVTSSGNQELDAQAVKAIEKSSPFKKLPRDFQGDGIRVNFKFDKEPNVD
ncbi:TonB C-terminal domain-containing protein [bacterium]|nr:TonB C-terminal domain-containing protein [bacterium]